MEMFNSTFILAVVAILLLEYIPGLKAGVRCYKCLIAAPVINYDNYTIRLCRDFDYSEKFIVDCPYSTFCMKKYVSAKIPNPINGTERDCASQKYQQHNYINRKWHIDYTIEDVYEEGCQVLDNKGARTTTEEYCYCKGDLCNSTNALGTQTVFYIATAVIIIFSRPFLCGIGV